MLTRKIIAPVWHFRHIPPPHLDMARFTPGHGSEQGGANGDTAPEKLSLLFASPPPHEQEIDYCLQLGDNVWNVFNDHYKTIQFSPEKEREQSLRVGKASAFFSAHVRIFHTRSDLFKIL